MLRKTLSNEYHIYYVQLPDGFNEAVMPCDDGYTVYIDPRQSEDGMIRSYEHAMRHIKRYDFQKTNVQEIEFEAHKGETA